MSDQKSYYNEGENRSLTYLEFGSIDTATCEKKIWDFRLHQEAYDFLMLSRYMKDLVAFKDMSATLAIAHLSEQLAIYQKNVFTHDIYNSFSKLAALQVCAATSRAVSFLEIGSTLMGCIEALEFLQKLGSSYDKSFSKIDLAEVQYHAVDISKLLNSVATICHPGYQIATYLDWKEVNFKFDVLFAKGVSLLYALATPQEFARIIGQARLGCFDYSLARGAEQQQYLGTGKYVKYLSADACLEAIAKLSPARELWIHRPSAEYDSSKMRIRGLFYTGSAQDIEAVTREEERLHEIIAAHNKDLPTLNLLYYRDLILPLRGEFVPLSKYMASI
jgi:hypothetical protein